MTDPYEHNGKRNKVYLRVVESAEGSSPSSGQASGSTVQLRMEALKSFLAAYLHPLPVEMLEPLQLKYTGGTQQQPTARKRRKGKAASKRKGKAGKAQDLVLSSLCEPDVKPVPVQHRL